MEHAHTNQDQVLAAFLEPGTLQEIATRVNMSLAALATWAGDHADVLAKVHALLVTRCKLLAAHLEIAALSALASVSSAATTTDDPALRERALERQRKAANAILRHKTSLERTPRASKTNPERELGLPRASERVSTPHASATGFPRAAPSAPAATPKPSLAQRLAARRLATLNTA